MVITNASSPLDVRPPVAHGQNRLLPIYNAFLFGVTIAVLSVAAFTNMV